MHDTVDEPDQPAGRRHLEQGQGGLRARWQVEFAQPVEDVADDRAEVDLLVDRCADLVGDELLHVRVLGQRSEGRDELIGVHQLKPRPRAHRRDRRDQHREHQHDARDDGSASRPPPRRTKAGVLLLESADPGPQIVQFGHVPSSSFIDAADGASGSPS